jgi:murein DD-endopeptidase MepM/ murein hydrolase activator NlpD
VAVKIPSLVISLLFISATNAAMSPGQNSEAAIITKKIKGHDLQIETISKELMQLERDLGSNQKRFLQAIERRKAIELEVASAQEKAFEATQLLEAKRLKARKGLHTAVANSVGGDYSAAELLAQNILIKNLQKELASVEAAQAKGLMQQKSLELLMDQLREQQNVEGQLSSLLSQLEAGKNTKAGRYVEIVKEKESLESGLAKIKASKMVQPQVIKPKAESNIAVAQLPRFKLPLEEFVGIDHQKKGVSFTFRGIRPVHATRAGRVAYSGSLSTYGNVVMIDHGNETRSVILGQFTPKVEKGMMVGEDDVLGYTKEAGGKLYFEVRLQNRVQDTIKLIDGEALARIKDTTIKS